MAQVFCALAAAGLGGAVLVAAVCLGVAGGGVFLVWGGMLGGAIEFCVLELVWASNFVGVGLGV